MITVLLYSLVACENKRLELVDPEFVYRDGLIYLPRSTEPLTADVEQLYEGGQLDQYTVIDGKKEGLHRHWDDNGQPNYESNYINGECVSGCR